MLQAKNSRRKRLVYILKLPFRRGHNSQLGVAVKVNPKILSVILNLLDGVTDTHMFIGKCVK